MEQLFDRPEPQRPTEAFLKTYDICCAHISQAAHACGRELRWIRNFPYGAALEDFSFFYGGQAYFVRIVDEGTKLDMHAIGDLMRIARGYDGYACLMPVFRGENGECAPIFPDWGLIDIVMGESVDPERLATDEPFEITAWELYDFAVQAVRETLEQKGHVVTSWLCDPGIYPSLWYRDKDTHELAWIMVNPFRSDTFGETVPDNLKTVGTVIRQRGYRGYYCAVGLMPLHDEDRLYRGRGASIRIGDMQEILLDDEDGTEKPEQKTFASPKLSMWKNNRAPHSLKSPKHPLIMKRRGK